MFIKANLLEPLNKSLITNANMQIMRIELHLNIIDVPLKIDLSASTKLQSLFVETYNVGELVSFTFGVLPMLEVFHCYFCTVLDLNICRSPNLKTLRL